MAIWQIPVGDFRMSAKRICIIYMYVLSNSSIPVGDLANTGWRSGQYRLAISPIPAMVHFKDLGRFEVEIENSKNMGGLKIMPRYGIKNKKK